MENIQVHHFLLPRQYQWETMSVLYFDSKLIRKWSQTQPQQSPSYCVLSSFPFLQSLPQVSTSFYASSILSLLSSSIISQETETPIKETNFVVCLTTKYNLGIFKHIFHPNYKACTWNTTIILHTFCIFFLDKKFSLNY